MTGVDETGDPTQLDRIEAKLDVLLALLQGVPAAGAEADEDADTLREHAEIADRLDDLSGMLDVSPDDLRVAGGDDQP